MSGCGISADSDGNLYLSIANGPFDAFGEQPGVDLSDSIVKLKPAFGRLGAAGLLHPFQSGKNGEGRFGPGIGGRCSVA